MKSGEKLNREQVWELMSDKERKFLIELRNKFNSRVIEGYKL